MKILILGSSGMLGTQLESICLQKNLDYVALKHQDFDATNFIELKNYVDNYSPSVIINCIAFVGINPCEEDPIKSYKVNTLIPYELIKISNEKNITLIHFSSHAVFDGYSDSYYTENDIPKPLNIYGSTKLEADLLIQQRCKKYYLFRLPTMFGTRRNGSLGFVDKMIIWMNEKDFIKVADDKIDTPTYAKDVANKVIEFLLTSKKFGLYHIANSGMTSYYDFVHKIKEIKQLNCTLVRAKDADFDSLAPKPLKTSLISTKINPLRSWQDALLEYLNEDIK